MGNPKRQADTTSEPAKLKRPKAIPNDQDPMEGVMSVASDAIISYRPQDDAKSAYNEAIIELDNQRTDATYQGLDARIFYQHLRLASPASKHDVEFVTDNLMKTLVSQGKPLPPRAVVINRGIPTTAPKSLLELALRVQEVYGGTKNEFTPQNKSGDLYSDNFHLQVDVNEFIQHYTEPENATQIWNLLEAGTHIFPHAASWIPDYVTEDNLIYDIRARSLGTHRPDTNRFTDKTSWYLVGDAGAYSTLHFDSHGFGTFLHLLCGEILLVFSNDSSKDPVSRERILNNTRAEKEPLLEDQEYLRKHLRYMILRPGQMWYMEPGTLHAVYRKEGTLIFGGHYIPKKKLGLWIEKVADHLREYKSTNEDPDDVLLYIRRILELVLNAKETSRLDGFGESEQLTLFFNTTKEVLQNGPEWMKGKEDWEGAKGKNWMAGWKREAKRLLQEHKELLGLG